MTNFDDQNSDALDGDIVNGEMRLEVCIARARRFFQEQVEDGLYGNELVYALSYVATELGLVQTNNGFYVLPRILEGIVDAAKLAHRKELDAEALEREMVQDPNTNIVSLEVQCEQERDRRDDPG